MPIIKSAIKKMRKDRVRTKKNLAKKLNIKKLLKQARRNPSDKSLKAVFSVLDKAAKTKLIHPNKAARLKSRLAKSSAEKTAFAKPAAKKSPAKKAIAPKKTGKK